ncbi:MAG: branched-chain amino acid aminotransferase [Nitrospiraceae bacterium]|nr:branched-chain amino acid aminotransferase [Nitrospiraceae bacterium]
MLIYLNDRFVKEDEAVVSVFDHGFLYGDGVYETIRSYGNRIFMRDQHLARLRRSADAIGLTIPIPEHRWPALLHEAMTRNDLGDERTDAYLRITISRGAGGIGLDPALCQTPTLVIMTKPLTPPSPQTYRNGVSLIVAKTRRNLPSALDPQIKATNFLNNILAKREAIAAGAFDSILLNWESHLTECTISNLFFVRTGRLCTPALSCGLLDGITRDIVLSLAREARIPIDEGHFGIEAIHKADECFITNTSMEVMPVTIVDGHPVGVGTPGPLTQQLHRDFVANRAKFLEP